MRSFSGWISLNRYFCVVGAVAVLALANPALAAEKPPIAPDQDTPLVVQSRVSAVLSFSARALAEELDREVRGRLKNLREGTSEWEVEYGRLIDQMRHSKAM